MLGLLHDQGQFISHTLLLMTLFHVLRSSEPPS
jgi:hypothetical protein